MEWVKFQKLKWEFQRKQRTERKRLRAEVTEMGMGTGNVKGRPMTGMSTFLHRQAKSIMDHNWQLIQVKMINLRSCCCLLLLFVIVICYCYCYCYCYLFVVVVVVVVVVFYCYLFLVCCRRHG